MGETRDRFVKAKRAVGDAEAFIGMIGAPYQGGGGGVGEVRNVEVVEFVVHFQQHDGATNYHKAPSDLLDALDVVVKRRGVELLREAINVLRDNKRAAASDWHAEMEAVAAEMVD